VVPTHLKNISQVGSLPYRGENKYLKPPPSKLLFRLSVYQVKEIFHGVFALHMLQNSIGTTLHRHMHEAIDVWSL